MAERNARKAKGQLTQRSAKARTPAKTAAQRSAARVKSLEQECDRLKAQLALAKERIADLEESRVKAVNRIDWVIDSLQSVLETEA